MKVVIVGGGFGGVKSALKLAEDKRFEVTLISDQTTFRYYPALYRSATGSSHIESVIPYEEIFEGVPVKVVKDKVNTIDVKAKTFNGDAGEYGYDTAILALGVVTNYFGIKGLPEYSYGIKSIEEAFKFKHHLHQELLDDNKPDANYVVIGGGPTGVELAAALSAYMKKIASHHGVAEMPIKIDLIEAAPRILPRMPEAASKKVTKRLEKLGVNVMTGKTVEGETPETLTVSGEPIQTETVVWTAGVTNHPFYKQNAAQFTLGERGKPQVDKYLQAAPDVYVIGDNAPTQYSGLAETAINDAVFLASHLKRKVSNSPLKPYKPKTPTSVLPVGVNWAVVQRGSWLLYGRPAWWLRRAADFIAYRDIEPTAKALKLWLADNKREEDCPVCAKIEAA